MNDERLNDIRVVRGDLSVLDQTIKRIMNEEEEYHDNIPKNPLEYEAIERSEEAIAFLVEAFDSVQDAISALMEIQ